MSGALVPVLAGLAALACGLPLLVVVHEVAHAWVARVRGLEVRPLELDAQPGRAGLRLDGARCLGRGDWAGYVAYDAGPVTPRDVAAVALAGPAASVAFAAVALVLAGLSFRHAWAPGLALLAVVALAHGVASLRPAGSPADPHRWSDGRWLRVARAATTTGSALPNRRDPREATSVAPPHAVGT